MIVFFDTRKGGTPAARQPDDLFTTEQIQFHLGCQTVTPARAVGCGDEIPPLAR